MNINIEKIRNEKPIEELIRFGIINIDKPNGPASFSVSQYVKKELGLNKTSHLGTLDPAVSGVLPVALGRACRLNEYLMHRNKVYVGIMRMHKDFEDKVLRKAVEKFIGKIMQMPPLRSNVKRALREREIKSFEIIEIKEKDVLFKTEVQAGTYIRTLCVDIGKEFGGAHMLELRRICAGIFDEKESTDLYKFDKIIKEYKNGDDKKLREIIVPGEVIGNILPKINIEKKFLKNCLTGSPLFNHFIINKEIVKELNAGDKICVFCDERFVGGYYFIGKKELIAKPEFVFN
jgi:H/ACA ribonucleoprotein complex subunit 4